MSIQSKIVNLFQNIRKEALAPKVYSVVVGSRNNTSLYMGIHYTLEDAIIDAIAEAVEKFTGTTESGWALVMFRCVTIDELEEKMIVGHISVTDLRKDKNFLMKKIIDEQDVKLFEKNKDMFSTAEIRMIKDELKI